MKKSRLNNSVRKLRCETLEQRQLLSVNPISADAGVVEQVLVAQPVTSDAVIDVSSAEKATGDLTFTPQVEGTKSLYNVTWDAIDGAESYIIQKQNDSGVWITYRKTATADDPTAPTTDVQGLYASKGDATFRVYGVYGGSKKVLDDDGAVVYREGTFSPISISANTATYAPLEETTINLIGSDSASAEIHWYSVTEDGDVEITAAVNRLSYTPTATESNYDLKIVATGTGASAGSTSEVIVKAVESQISATYDMTTHKGTLSWSPVDGATKYEVRICRDGASSYTKYADVTDPTVVVNGLYAANSAGAHTYKFRVIARNDSKEVVGHVAGTVAPISVATESAAYKAGQDINATIRTAGTVGSVEWFLTDSAEGTQAELADTSNDTPLNLDPNTTSWTIPSDFATSKIKIVVKGAGLAQGLTAVTVVDVSGSLQAGEFGDYSTINRNVPTMWNQVGAASYRFLKGRVADNGDVIWARAATITVANGEVTSGNATITDDGKIQYTVNMVNVGVEGLYKVAAYDANGKKFDEQEFSYTPFGLELDDDSYQVNTGSYIITATTIALDAESEEYKWYISEDGVTWTESTDGNGDYIVVNDTFNHDSRRFQIKLVVTDGERSSVVYAKANDVDNPLDLNVSVTDDNLLNMQFKGVSDATGYQVEYYLSDAEYPVWINLTNVTYVDNGDGTITATHVNGANYEDYDIRVRALKGDNLWSEWNGRQEIEYETPSLEVTIQDDILDPTDGEISLREALLYQKYLGGGEITFGLTEFHTEEEGGTGTTIYLVPETGNTVSYPGVYTDAVEGGSLLVDGEGYYTEIFAYSDQYDGRNVVIDGSQIGDSIFTVTGQGLDIRYIILQNANTGENGGAISVIGENSYLAAMYCDFVNNTGANGGAIYYDSDFAGWDPSIIVRCKFIENNATRGGAVYTQGKGLLVTQSEFRNNSTTSGPGAALFVTQQDVTLAVDNSLFVDNVCNSAGGVVYATSGARVAFNNVTSVGNLTNNGAYYVTNGGELGIYNSILGQNEYVTVINSTLHAYNVLTPYASSLVSDGDCDNLFELEVGESLFTDAESGDYTLTADSQARGLGDFNHYSLSPWWQNGYDLAGNSRLNSDNSLDLGAYAYQQQDEPVDYETPSLTVTTTRDILDPTDGVVSLREALLYQKYLGGGTINFDSSVFPTPQEDGTGQVITLVPNTGNTVSYPGVYTDAVEGGSLLVDGAGYYTEIIASNGQSKTRNVVIDGSQIGDSIFSVTGQGLDIRYIVLQNANTDENGGAISVTGENSYLAAFCCDFVHNTGNNGGAIFYASNFESWDASVIAECKFIENEATNAGGAIYTQGWELDVTRSEFLRNRSDNNGAALGAEQDAVLFVDNSLIADNMAVRQGGAVYVPYRAKVIFNHVTSVGNMPVNDGAAYYVTYGSTLELYNSILGQNEFVAIVEASTLKAYNVLAQYASSLVSYCEEGACDNLFDLEVGGSLFTDAESGDYTLTADSQARGLGDPNLYFNLPHASEWDLARNPRINGDGSLDLGAYAYNDPNSDALLDEAFADFFEDEFDF